MGNCLSFRIASLEEIRNESSSSEKKKSKIVNNLVDEFFSASKSLTVKEFMVQSLNLLTELHPAFQDINIKVEIVFLPFYEWPYIPLKALKRDMNQTCEEFQFKLDQLETSENFRNIVDKIIPHVKYSSSIEREKDDKIEKREIFRKFLGHLLWMAKFVQEYKAARFDNDELRTIHYQAAKYYKTDAKLWLDLAEEFNNYINLKRDIINEAIEFVPDSLNLVMAQAKLDILNSSKDEIQEIIDRKLISYADAGFEIKPKEWIRALKDAKMNKIIDPLMISLLKFVPDSEWLRIAVAKIAILDSSKDEIQEIIDHTLISFADDGFEFDPNEWIEAAKKTDSKEIEDSVMISIIGIKGLEKIVKSSEIYLKHEKRILFQMLKASLEDKSIWIRAIFHKVINSYDLKLLLTIAYEKSPDDYACFVDLTQAKIQWMNRKFGVAQRLFCKVKADITWENLIIKKIEKFQSELEVVRAERKNMIEENLSKLLRKTPSYFFIMLQMILKEEWLLGGHDNVQEFLEKIVTIRPQLADFWLMKIQIEMREEDYATAATTLNRAIESVFWTHERVFFLLTVANLVKKKEDFEKTKFLLKKATLSSSTITVETWIALIRFEVISKENSKAQILLSEAMEKFQRSGQVWVVAIFMEERSEKGKKSAEALKICQDEPCETKFVMLETAKLFFNQGKVEKSRKWFNKTVDIYPNFYDAWIYYFKLEKIWGTEESARDILIRFIQVVKRESDHFVNHRQFYNYHGEKWCNSEYHIDNWHLTKEELFEAIVDKIDVGSTLELLINGPP